MPPVTSIGRLNAEITARSKKFEAGFARANKSLKKHGRAQFNVQKQVANTNRAFASFRRSVGVLTGVGGLAAITRGSMQYAVRIGEIRDRMSLTTKETQDFFAVTTRMNIPFEKAAMALQRWTRRVGEAQKGRGEFLETAREINLQLFDMEGRAKSSTRLLLEFADATQKTATGQEKLANVFKAMDSEGADLVRILKLGSEGYKELAKEGTEAMGALSAQTIENMTKANRAIEEFKRTAQIRIASIISGGPEMEETFKLLTLQFSKVATKFGMFLMENVVAAGEAVTKIVAKPLIKSVKESGSLLKELGARVGKFAGKQINANIVRLNPLLTSLGIKQIPQIPTSAFGRLDKAEQDARGAFMKSRGTKLPTVAEEFEAAFSKGRMDKIQASVDELFEKSILVTRSRLNRLLSGGGDRGATPPGPPPPGRRRRIIDPRSLDQKKILQTLNQAALGPGGESRGIRFQRMATGGFQRFVDGRKAGQLSNVNAVNALARQQLQRQRREQRDQKNIATMTESMSAIEVIMQDLKAALSAEGGASAGGGG